MNNNTCGCSQSMNSNLRPPMPPSCSQMGTPSNRPPMRPATRPSMSAPCSQTMPSHQMPQTTPSCQMPQTTPSCQTPQATPSWGQMTAPASMQPMAETWNRGTQNQQTSLNCSQLQTLIDQTSFALDDILLYLDTHPCDQAALEYYRRMANIRIKAMNDYQADCSPLMADQANADNYWTWVSGKWPWEGGSC